MPRKKCINYLLFLAGYIFMCISLFMIIYVYADYKENTVLIKKYFDTNSLANKSIETSKEENYLGILEIPKIKLKRGFYNIESKNNNVNKNIQVLKKSQLPSIENNILALASHSGNGIYSYFNKINNLNISDLLYIYYLDKKYIYEINDIYKIEKNGNLEISYTNNSQLILTTCDKLDKTKQLVIKSQLKEIATY